MPFPIVSVVVEAVGFAAVVKVFEAEYALVPLEQTVCTWNSYCVEAVSPLMDFELVVDVVLIHVEEETAL